MRIYKKIALMAIIFILSATLTVYAGETVVTMKASSTEVKVGDTVTVTVSAKCGTRIEGVDSVLEYDKTKLELVNEGKAAATGYMDMSGVNGKTGKYQLTMLYNGTDETPQEADVAELEFKVLSGAKANDNLSIKLSEIELADSNKEGTDLEDQSVTLKVKADNPDDGNNPGDGDNTGDGDKPGDGDYPYAGAESYVFAIAGVIVVAVVLYKKTNKYKDIK